MTPAGASPFSAWKVESILETALDWPAALNAGDAGSHGAENQMEASGNLFARVCAIAKPSAMMSGTAKAKPAHFRSMHQCYIRVRVRAIRFRTEGEAGPSILTGPRAFGGYAHVYFCKKKLPTNMASIPEE